MTESLDEVLEEIKSCYKMLLNSKLKSLGDEKTLDNLPKETGVYIIYDKDKPPLYVGESKHLRTRLRTELFHFAHTLSTRLLKERVLKNEGIRLTSKQLDKKETWYGEKRIKSKKEVISFLKNLWFQYMEIKGKNERGKAKLLERLVQVMLNPKIKDYKEEG